jgi:hypothetical protein
MPGVTMEFVEIKDIRLQRLLRLHIFLKTVFVLILLALSVFFVKHLLLAIISVQKSGVRLDSVADVIKYHFVAFFSSFGNLTSKYMLTVSVLLFINVVGLTVNKLWKLFKPRMFSIMLFFFSIVAAFNLPMEKIYTYFSRNEKTGLMVFCLVLMIPGPHILGTYLAEDPITRLIYRKVFYVVIYALLLIQLLIEW